MPKTLDDYAAGLRDPRNVAALKQFPLPEGGGIACGKGDDPDTTIAIVAGQSRGGLIAVQSESAFEAREIQPAQHAQAEINAIALKAIKFCQKLNP